MSKREPWARFWAVDLHVHTPGSGDADEADFGNPSDIVQAAIEAGLDCVAITDHNTAAWCEQMADAAKDTSLVVLPGVELSTPDGHLLGVWEEGTSANVIEDVLVGVGITRAQQGRLDVNTRERMIDCASAINKSGGIAIAAHIEKERGVLRQPVQTHVNEILGSAQLSGLEFVHAETPQIVIDKLGNLEPPALIQASDCWSVENSRHSLSGIGARRTWIKASRPDLRGIRHALDDSELRVTLSDPNELAKHPSITNVAISAGFMGGVSLDLSPDLNCLLGGTGAGKSLVLEAIRFALDQQVDGDIFEQVRDEVDRRLQFALEEGSTVSVELVTGNERYKFTRAYSPTPGRVLSEQWVSNDWVEVDVEPTDLFPIAAFSQGEILEYARQRVGRVGLIDAHLDLSSVEDVIATSTERLRTNARRLMTARQEVESLSAEAAKAPELDEQVQKLSQVFNTDAVKQQAKWTKEQGALDLVRDSLAQIAVPDIAIPDIPEAELRPDHDDLFTEVDSVLKTLDSESAIAITQYEASVKKAKASLEGIRNRWQTEFTAFKAELDRELAAVPEGKSLPSLRVQLEGLQTKLGVANTASKRLTETARPELEAALEEREQLLEELRGARQLRRTMRRGRVADLNRKMSGSVQIDIPRDGDTSQFRKKLDTLKVGSRVREEVLDVIAERIHPFRFVRALWAGDVNALVDPNVGIGATDIGRLMTNIADRDMWSDLLETQLIENPDVLNINFLKPEEGSYVSIESLSHGQKCTAILVILMADGDSPVLVDQPEDALHAPWIEESLVKQLRRLRGSRQYVFATRSPGLVVSADAEQIITMKATAGRGQCEASGSLERHNLNELTLHHLEGGKTPFARRARKLNVSIAETS